MQADHQQVARLLKTARGQLDGILKMIDEDRYCIDVSNQIMAAMAILDRANREVITAHLKTCLLNASDAADRKTKVDEIVDLIDRMPR